MSAQPTKAQKIKWAKNLCSLLNDKGIQASHKWFSDDQELRVNYRIDNALWNLWKTSPDAFGGKPSKKIQTVWLLPSTCWVSNLHGEMVPQSRWLCEETDQILGSMGEVAAYASDRAKKF